MEKEKVFIFPFGGNAWEAIDCLNAHQEFLGFIDDNEALQGKHPSDFEIFSREILSKYPESKLLAVIGNPINFRERQQIINSFKLPKNRFTNIIHPSAQISEFAQIGYNNLIMANVVITWQAFLGNHIIILPNTTIHHDVVLEDYNWIGSNVSIAGSVRIGKNCWIGSGSNLVNNITIGKKTLIGMGSNVLQSFGENKKVVGNPAKEILS